MMRKILFFIFFIFGLIIVSFSQNNYFTDSTYIQDLEKFLSSSFSAKPELKTEFDKFVNHWDTLKTMGYDFGVVFVSNSLKKNYAKPYPDFYNYIRTVNKLIEINKSDYYQEWEVGLTSLMESNKIRKKIYQYLQVSADFICDSLLLRTGVVNWKAKADDYQILYTPEEGLYISFDSKATLYIHNGIDTMQIVGVRGKCYPLKKIWEGEGGKVFWTQANIYDQNVFVRMPDKYTFNMKSNKFTIDSVRFTNAYLNMYSKLGQLIFKLKISPQMQTSVFISYAYDDTLTLPYTPIKVKGQFVMSGNQIMFKEYKFPVNYWIMKNKEKNYFIHGKCQMLKAKYIIKNNQLLDTFSIIAPNSEINLNIKSDSIYHRKVQFRYYTSIDKSIYKPQWFNLTAQVENRPFISLYSTTKTKAMIPFSDDYHNIDIFASDMVWFKGDSILYILLTYHTSSELAYFQSANYYSERIYKYFSNENTDNINYLRGLYEFYQRNIDTTTLEEYKNKLSEVKSVSTKYLKEMLFKLQNEGFVKYYPDRDKIVILPKVARYMANYAYKRFAKIKDTTKFFAEHFKGDQDKKRDFLLNRIKDYDKIYIPAKPDGIQGVVGYINLKNGKLDVLNPQPFYLHLPRIDTVSLYDKKTVWKFKSVAVKPDTTLTIEKDMSIKFSGLLGAGLSAIRSKNFHFKYDDYTIDFKNGTMQYAFIDSNLVIHPLSTEIINVSGTLFINDPNNKSGAYLKPEFPKLKISNSEVNYKQGFKFNFYQYEIDSLNLLTNAAMNLQGNLITDIIPNQENTTLKPNKISKNQGYQLGFTKCKEMQGFPISKNEKQAQARFFGCIKLGDKGLVASGFLIYYNSIYRSNNFIFTSKNITTDNLDILVVNTDSLKHLFENGTFVNYEPKNEQATDTYDTLKIVLKNYLDFLRNTGQYSIYTSYVNNTPIIFNYKKLNSVNFVFDKKDVYIDLKRNTLVAYPELGKRKPYFNGKLSYRNSILLFNGQLSFNKGSKFNNAIITDTAIVLKRHSILNRDFSAYFTIKGSFTTNSQKFNISVPQKKGVFTSSNINVITFEKNKYVCSADHFLWDIEQGLMKIGQRLPGEEDVEYIDDINDYKEAKKKNKNVRFFGALLSPYKDETLGPKFAAGYVDFNTQDYLLVSYKVPEISLADAVIYPHEQLVKIKINAEFDTLNKVSLKFFELNISTDTVLLPDSTQIVRNDTVRDFKYTFNEVYGLKILDKDAYTATAGIYNYPFKIQRVFVNDIHYDRKQLRSIAISNTLKETDHKLDLNEYFRITDIKGFQMRIERTETYPFFSGYVLPTLLAEANNEGKLYQKANRFFIKNNQVNHLNVVLDFQNGSKGYSYDKRTAPKLYAAVMYNNKFNVVDLFLERNANNIEILMANKENKIWYNKSAGEYQISSHLFTFDTTEAKAFTFNPTLNIFRAQGRFVLDTGFLRATTTIYGYYTHNYSQNKIILRGALVINDLPLPSKILDTLTKLIKHSDMTSIFDENNITKTVENYNKFIGPKQTREILEEVDGYKMPSEIKDNDIVFANVELHHYTYKEGTKKTHVWYSKGLLGLSSINGKRVDRYVPGYIFIVKKQDKSLIYIEFNKLSKPFVFLYNMAEGKTYLNVLYEPITSKFSGEIKDKYFSARSKQHKRKIIVIGKTKFADIETVINKMMLQKLKKLSDK